MSDNGKKSSKLGLICDVAFELVLILLVLLAAMLLSENDVIAGADGYRVEPVSLLVTFGMIAFYIAFIVRRSIRSMDKSSDEKSGVVKE